MGIVFKLMNIAGWFILVTAGATITWVIVVKLTEKKIVGGFGAGVILGIVSFIALWLCR